MKIMSMVKRLPQVARGFKCWHEAVLATLLIALFVYAHFVEPSFNSISTQLQLSENIWVMAIITLPMLLIIITGGIDLSVGLTLALSAVVLGLTYQAGVPAPIAACFAVVTGVFAGWVNGWFVAKLKVHPLIVTLATMAAFRGIAEGISLGKPVTHFPAGFLRFGQGGLWGIPYPAFVFLFLFAMLALAMSKTAFGRALFAIGHNEKAALFSGIRVGRIKLIVYTLGGALSGLAGAILVAHRDTAKADLSIGLELDVITAVVLGGASINGGRGNVVGLLLGIALLHETREFISFHWERNELTFIVGILLIVSVLLHRLLTRHSTQEDT